MSRTQEGGLGKPTSKGLGGEQGTQAHTEWGQTMVGRMVTGQDVSSTNLDNVKIRTHNLWEGEERGSG